MGGKVEVEDVGDKMNGLEKTKKFQFNNKKDETEVLAMKKEEEVQQKRRNTNGDD